MHPNDTPPTRVVFFQVKEAAAKLKCICETAAACFNRREHLIIFVEDAKAQDYVNDLLWKFPETSFLPHAASDEATRDFIAITKLKTNVNDAKIAFNLCPTPLLIGSPFRIIYDFEDLTHPSKNKLSSIRFDAYKAANCLIESRQGE